MPTSAQIKGKLKFYTKPYGRQWKWRWQIHGNYFEKELQIPNQLKDKNIEIIDPLHPKKKEKDPSELWKPPRRHPALDMFLPKPKPQDHPLYHENAVMLCDKSVKFHAGVEQVCLLTKTMPVYNNVTTKKQTVAGVTNEDTIVQNYIKQALAFNPTKEPSKPFNIPNDIKYHIGKEYATPNDQQMAIILENSIRYCNSLIKDNQKLLSRKLMHNASFYTTFQRADDHIHIRRNADFALYSTAPQQAIASKEEIEKTVHYKFIDLYPIFPTVDLINENIYENNHSVGWLTNNLTLNNPFKYVHTIFHINDDTFSTDADLARLIMFAFGYVHAQAKLYREKLEINSNSELKTPIVVNAVSMQNEKINMIRYQLNTLDLTTNSGVKNIVHIDKANELYLNRPNLLTLPNPSKRNIQRYAMRKLEYNAETFQKFKSIVLNDVL